LGHVIPIIQYSLKRKFLSLSTFIGEVIENHPELYVKGVYKVNLTFLFPVVVVLSPGHASQLFKRQTFEKPLMSAVIHFVLKGLFNLNGEEYKKHKRILAPAFKTTGAVDRVHDTFYLFEEDMKTKDNISFVMDDTYNSLVKCSEAMFFDSIGFPDYNLFKAGARDRIEMFEKIFELSLSSKTTQGRPQNLPFLAFKNIPQPHESRLLRLYMDNIYEQFMGIINKRKAYLKKESNFKSDSFLDNLINSELNDRDILGEFIIMYGATLDTVALVTTCILHEIGHKQEIQEKLINELDQYFCEQQVQVKQEDLAHLNYFKAVVKEGIRFYPPGHYIVREDQNAITLEMDETITIPRNTIVLVHLKALNYNPMEWKEPRAFNPDRFLEDSFERNPISFATFAHGHRQCPGINIAMSSIQATLVNILLKYRVKSLDEYNSIPLKTVVLTHPEKEFRMEFIKRK